jgi:hypothetical protein
MITFLASKHKQSEDKEGEVTLILKIPLTEAHKVRIPVEKSLRVSIEVEDLTN